MKVKELSHYDKELIREGLQMRICYIETRNPLLRAVDLENQNKSVPKCERKPLRALTIEQMAIIIECEELLTKLGY